MKHVWGKEKVDEMKKLQVEVDELTQKLKERENTSLNHEDIKTDKNIKLWTGTTN